MTGLRSLSAPSMTIFKIFRAAFALIVCPLRTYFSHGCAFAMISVAQNIASSLMSMLFLVNMSCLHMSAGFRLVMYMLLVRLESRSEAGLKVCLRPLTWTTRPSHRPMHVLIDVRCKPRELTRCSIALQEMLLSNSCARPMESQKMVCTLEEDSHTS